MASGWNHALCDPCWVDANPGRQPMRMAEGHREEEVCCGCAEFTVSGIYVRGDPADYPCRGTHGTAEG